MCAHSCLTNVAGPHFITPLILSQDHHQPRSEYVINSKNSEVSRKGPRLLSANSGGFPAEMVPDLLFLGVLIFLGFS